MWRFLGRLEIPNLGVILIFASPQNAWDQEDKAALERLGSDAVTVTDMPFSPTKLQKAVHDFGFPDESQSQRAQVRGGVLSRIDYSDAT
jgi:hypothetical protein